METLIVGSIVCLVPLLVLVLWRRLGLETFLRWGGIIIIMLVMIVIFNELWMRLSDNYRKIITIGIVAPCWIYGLGKALLVYSNHRRAGQILFNGNDTDNLINNALVTVMVIVITIQIANDWLSYPKFMATKYYVPYRGTYLFWFLPLYFAILRNLNTFELGEHGIHAKEGFIPWHDIQDIQWDHVFYKEKLNIKRKGSAKIYKLSVPWKHHLAIDEYLKKRFEI